MRKGHEQGDSDGRDRPSASSPSVVSEGSSLLPIGEDGRRRTPRDVDADTIATRRPGAPERARTPTGDPAITFRKPRMARGSRPPSERLPLRAPRDDDTELDLSLPALGSPSPRDRTARLEVERRPQSSRAIIAALAVAIAMVVAAIAMRLMG